MLIPSMIWLELWQGVTRKYIMSNLLQFEYNLAHNSGLSVSLPVYSPATGHAGKYSPSVLASVVQVFDQKLW